MRRPHLPVVFALAVVALSACSPDETACPRACDADEVCVAGRCETKTARPDGGTDAGTDHDGGHDADGGTDAGADGGSDGGTDTGAIRETETATGQNDTREQAQAITRAAPFTLVGNLHEPAEEELDFDWYSFTTTAPGQLFRLTLAVPSDSAAVPVAVVRAAPPLADRFLLRLLPTDEEPAGTSFVRELFLPEAGTYFLGVTTNGELAESFGGEGHAYRLSLDALPAPTPAAATLPLSAMILLDEETRIEFRRVEATADQKLVASYAEADDFADAVLMLYRPADGRVVAINDDATAETYGAALEFEGTANEELWLVADVVEPAPGETLALTAELRSSVSTETEPNDAPASANELDVGASPMQAAIDAKPEADRDHFMFLGEAGLAYTVRATAAAGSQVDPSVTVGVLGPNGLEVLVSNDDSDGVNARADFIAADDDIYVVIVEHGPNRAGAPVGGDGYGYAVSVEELAISPADLGTVDGATELREADVAIDPGGTFATFAFEATAEGIVVIDAANARGGLEPELTLFDEDLVPLQQSTGTLRFLTGAAPYVLAVRDVQGRGGANMLADLSITLVETTAAAAEPNDDATTAGAISAGALLLGELTAADVDWYRFTIEQATMSTETSVEKTITVSPSRLFSARLLPGLDGAAQGTLDVVDATGTVLAAGTTSNGAPAIVDWPVPRPGTYFLRVRGANAGDAGSYVVTMEYAGCKEIPNTVKPTATGSARVVINELMYDPPSGTAGDANGDGARHSREDEFIELRSLSTSAIDLSGVYVTNKNKAQIAFACGTVLPAGKAIVTFGGGTPTGTFGGTTVLLAHPGSGETSANLVNSADTLTLRDANHEKLDQFAWGGTTGNACAQTSCERQGEVTDPNAPPPLTPRSTPLAPKFTPGLRDDGSAF